MFKLLKSSITTYLFILAISAAFLFAIKHKVQNLNKELNEINSKIVSEKENIHILKAEYTYLTNPKRIKKLIDSNLALQTVKPDQIVEPSAIQPTAPLPVPIEKAEGVQ
jgi:cell division protein FtsL